MATQIIVRNIDETVHKALKVRAATEGIYLHDLIRKILFDAVKKGKK